MMLYLQPSTCHSVMFNKTQTQSFIYYIIFIILYYVMSCRVVSGRVVSCRVESYLIVSYHHISYMSYISYHIISYRIISPYRILWYRIMSCHVNSSYIETKHTTKPSQWYHLFRIWSYKCTWRILFYVPHTSQNQVLNTEINLLLYLVKFCSISCWPFRISRNWAPAANASTKVWLRRTHEGQKKTRKLRR
jgi:hypothetical protein